MALEVCGLRLWIVRLSLVWRDRSLCLVLGENPDRDAGIVFLRRERSLQSPEPDREKTKSRKEMAKSGNPFMSMSVDVGGGKTREVKVSDFGTVNDINKRLAETVTDANISSPEDLENLLSEGLADGVRE